jgi:hypothetical protein
MRWSSRDLSFLGTNPTDRMRVRSNLCTTGHIDQDFEDSIGAFGTRYG